MCTSQTIQISDTIVKKVNRSRLDRTLITDGEGRIEAIDPHLAQQILRESGDLIGHDLSELVQNSERELLAQILERFSGPQVALPASGLGGVTMQTQYSHNESLQLVPTGVRDQDGTINLEWTVLPLSKSEAKPVQPTVPALYRLSFALLRAQTLPEVTQITVQAIRQIISADGLILTIQNADSTSQIRVIDGTIPGAIHTNPRLQREFDQISRRSDPLIVPIDLDGQGRRSSAQVLLAPLWARERFSGSLLVLRSSVSTRFRPREEQLLNQILEQVGLAVAHVHLRQEAEMRIEESTQVADRLLRSNAELRRFAYIASHDLQEPLRMVSSFIQLLSRRYREQAAEDIRTYFDHAQRGVESMREMLQDLLLYAQIENRPVEQSPVESQDVLEKVISTLDSHIEASGARIQFEGLPVIPSDEFLLSQLFYQLLDNALKFRSESTPEVWIRAEQRGDNWHFQVGDRGIGIDATHHERIFDIFRSLQPRVQNEGTGMGLAIARRIVEWHSGQIWIESAPGNGTIVNFTLPVVGSNDEDERPESAGQL